ncbi:NAD(P)-binding domain protein [Akanthomyces lecanii RCEF 1005]|uniref:NAD(P)-binding domain protein n=1 Tax=Akanthomyces lecanii RCEF 1005 TaxID=1081108 RepID=A0A168G3Y7_CORDF|nr:NAD(P)-binding domain protein [Akanthomyces lecanii RCEF 1005]
MAAKAIVIVAGVGPGTGSAIARKFGAAYPIALLARKQENYEGLVKEINEKGGKAIGFSTDVSSEASVKAAFRKIHDEYGIAPVAAAIFNAPGIFLKKPLLDMSVDEFGASWQVSCKGAFIFSQATLPGLLRQAADSSAPHPPTLIFTNATAAIKANSQVSGFASAQHGMRALYQSIAREFAPQGVHVAHAIIDGAIDLPRTRELFRDCADEAMIGTGDIAEAYWNLHLQSKRGFTNEIDMRPMLEKW